jgi:hypothetical protein
MLINGYNYHMRGETPTDLRIGVPAHTPNFVGLTITLTEAQRKAAISSPYQLGRVYGTHVNLKTCSRRKPQRFAMLWINADLYNVVVCATSQFFGPLNKWWLNRKQHAAIPDSFDTLVEEIRKTSMLPNIRDDALNALLGLTQGNMSYAAYTHLFNDFLRRSRQPRKAIFSSLDLLVDWLFPT